MTTYHEQEEQLKAAAERALTKLGACIDGLPADERAVLVAVLPQIGTADPGADDTSGYSTPGTVLRAAYYRATSTYGGISGALNSVDWGKVGQDIVK